VNCTSCNRVLEATGFSITYVNNERLFTINLHYSCLSNALGEANARRLSRLALDSGWRQETLPGWESHTQIAPGPVL